MMKKKAVFKKTYQRWTDSLTLVVNLSLRSIRIIVLTDNLEKVYEDWLPIRTYINGETVEQDPHEWWQLLVELLDKLFQAKTVSTSIHYITVTSSALCLVLLDTKGNVIGKAIMVSDKRANEESMMIKAAFPEQFYPLGNKKIDPSFMLPKILWLKRNDKKLFTSVKKFMSSNDFLIYKLTGLFVTDNLNAEKFHYDSVRKAYPKDLLSFVGITPKQLPTTLPPGTLLGKLQENVKNDVSIKQNVKVSLATYDAICALIGSSSFKEGVLSNVCGTCSSYRVFAETGFDTGKTNLVVQELKSENLQIIGASNNLEGGVLEWAKECFYGDSFLRDDDFLYSLMQKEAQESEVGANGIIFLPYLLGERMPFSDPDVRGMFLGIERFHTRRDIIRSIFESVSFQAKLMVEEFPKSGFPISSIIMSGGMAKMSFAAQLRADVLGVPVHVLSEVETTAVGAAILTMRARKKFKNIKDAGKYIIEQKTYIPNMHNHNCYASLFLLYKQLYNLNKDLFRQRREVFDQINTYRKRVLENL